jgi:hypothetical protein
MRMTLSQNRCVRLRDSALGDFGRRLNGIASPQS